MTRWWVVELGLASVCFLAGCSLASGFDGWGPEEPPKSGPARTGGLEAGEVLAYSHSPLAFGLPDLYLLDGEQSSQVIARSSRNDTNPVWSPDGSQLVYLHSYGWEADLYQLEGNPLEGKRLTRDGEYKYLARWSLDGKRLAYLSTDHPGDLAFRSEFLNILEPASGESQRVHFERVLDYHWHPDNQSIVAITMTGNLVAVETVSLDGNREGSQQLDFLNGVIALSLAPDASQLAYARPDPDPEALVDPLYVAAIDGSQEKQVGTYATDSALSWSPDGTRLAFTTLGENYRYVLRVVQADGSGLNELLALDPADDSGEILPGSPAWSPDSQKIAIGSFTSWKGAAIMIVNADGSGIRQVTEPGGLVYDLSWRP